MKQEYLSRIERLRCRKLAQTKEKLDLLGFQDEDDYGYVLPPSGFKWTPPEQDGNGGFYGARNWGRNFRSLLECHPLYVDPDDAIAGRWMFMLSRMRRDYRLSLAPFPFDYSHLSKEQELYDITCGIGKDAHFAPDYKIGLELGWGGLRNKVAASLLTHADDSEAVELLEAELDAIAGVQSWIRRTAELAASMAEVEPDARRHASLQELSAVNQKLVYSKPSSFREACQWISWFNMASRTYNRDGAGGQLDTLLLPYYERDMDSGAINDDDATFLIACLLLNDPHYYQIGGPDRNGNDQTSKLSFLTLEAAHLLKVSCNLTIRVHDKMDERLFKRGIELLFEDKLGYPRFSGDKALVEGFMRSGFPVELARERIAVGCNWMSLPGREYTLNDVVKINMAKIFEIAILEALASDGCSSVEIFDLFCSHLKNAVRCTADGIRFHLEHQYKNEPELLLNLLSHGPVENGRDMSHGGAEFYNMCIDGAGLAVVADSFAAMAQRIERDGFLSWEDLRDALKNDFSGFDGINAKLLLESAEKFGQGSSLGDEFARRITAIFADMVKDEERNDGIKFMPGLFSWADTVRLGKSVGATPNGRHARTPISHGANPCAGFKRNGALTAIVKAVAEVQPGYGNTAPLQLEIDPGLLFAENAQECVGHLLKTHFILGGTLVNINIIDRQTLLDAHKHPERHQELTVRVTGFSAYFASLSKEFRQLVIDRVIGKDAL